MGRRGVPTIGWDEFVLLVGGDGDATVTLALNGQWIDSAHRREVLAASGSKRTSFRWVKALDVAQWHHYEGDTVTACGRRLGVSRQRAQQLLDLLVDAHPFDTPDHSTEQAESRSRIMARIYSDAVDIIRMEPGIVIASLAGRIGCSVTDVGAVLGDLAAFTNNPAWSAKSGRSRWTDDDIANTLRGMYEANNSLPLTKRVYEQLAAEGKGHAPSHPLIAKRFGSWSAALEFANLPTNETRQDYAWAHTRDEALDDLVSFVLDTGKTSAGEYRNWADSHPDALRVPQAILGRSKSWTDAIQQAFTALAGPVLGPQYQRMFDQMATNRADELSDKHGVDFALRVRKSLPSSTAPIPGEVVL